MPANQGAFVFSPYSEPGDHWGRLHLAPHLHLGRVRLSCRSWQLGIHLHGSWCEGFGEAALAAAGYPGPPNGIACPRGCRVGAAVTSALLRSTSPPPRAAVLPRFPVAPAPWCSVALSPCPCRRARRFWVALAPGPLSPHRVVGRRQVEAGTAATNPRGASGEARHNESRPVGTSKRYGSTAGSASSLNQAQRGHASLGYDDVKVGHLRFGVPKVDHRVRAGAVTLVSADSL